jgi:hypothetical protein
MVFTKGYSQKDTLFDIHYHKNGKISTKSVIFQDEIIWGYAKAFNKKGDEIYSMGTRRCAGNASVDFSYYEDGSVSKAHATSHPDGGIQWGDLTHYFDQEGNITNIEDRSSDMYGHPQLQITYDPVFEYKENPVIQEVVQCAEIYESEFYLINLSGKPFTISISNKGGLDDKKINTIITRRDTVLMNSYIEAQIFTHPKDFLDIKFLNKSQKKPININSIWGEAVQVSRTKRAYYLVVFD